MRRFSLIVSGILLAIFLMIFGALLVQAAPQSSHPTCGLSNLVPERGENHVEFAATTENGGEGHEYPFYFGDGDSVVLTGTNASFHFGHDYPYIPGEVVTYTFGFTVTSDVTTTTTHCHHWVGIDFRPVDPVCELDWNVGTPPNEIVFNGLCEEVEEGWYEFDFGNEITTNIYISQTVPFSLEHWYSYEPEGMVQYTAGFEELGLWTEVVIDDSEVPAGEYKANLPLVVWSAKLPSCSVRAEVDSNNVRLFWTWRNATNQVWTTDFGDGSKTQQLFGTDGTEVLVEHDYPWPGGEFTASTTFEGTGEPAICSTTFDINFN